MVMPGSRQTSGSRRSGRKDGGGRKREGIAPGVAQYAAAVRYQDGQKDFFHVKNVTSVEEARVCLPIFPPS